MVAGMKAKLAGLNADVKGKMTGLRVKDKIDHLDVKGRIEKLDLKEKVGRIKAVDVKKWMPSFGKTAEAPQTEQSEQSEQSEQREQTGPLEKPDAADAGLKDQVANDEKAPETGAPKAQ